MSSREVNDLYIFSLFFFFLKVLKEDTRRWLVLERLEQVELIRRRTRQLQRILWDRALRSLTRTLFPSRGGGEFQCCRLPWRMSGTWLELWSRIRRASILRILRFSFGPTTLPVNTATWVGPRSCWRPKRGCSAKSAAISFVRILR